MLVNPDSTFIVVKLNFWESQKYEGLFYKMTNSQDSSLSKRAIEDYFKNYLQENDYPDGPFELLDLAKVQYQIDVWK